MQSRSFIMVKEILNQVWVKGILDQQHCGRWEKVVPTIAWSGWPALRACHWSPHSIKETFFCIKTVDCVELTKILCVILTSLRKTYQIGRSSYFVWILDMQWSKTWCSYTSINTLKLHHFFLHSWNNTILL